jgi:hypothetical protein
MVAFDSYRRRRRAAAIALLVASAAAVACGPELTTAASTDISGAWLASGPAAGLTEINVQLAQTADGAITGTYTATGTASLQFCPQTGPCSISSTVSGSNTVLQVFFDLKDAGVFTGQLIDANTMRGAMSRMGATSPVEFIRAINAVPATP